MANTKKIKPVVLGLGNLLFQDEGIGIHAIDKLKKNGSLAGKAELIDGGTAGLMMLGLVENASRLIIVDAIDGNLAPGTIQRLEGAEVSIYASQKLYSHQMGFQEILDMAAERGKLPELIVLFGVQPASMNWSPSLSPVVSAVMPELMKQIIEQVEQWLLQE
ncbi:MAG: HyaD/HybD family hydrogenase maturation endopeptidase [Syntrophomonas sp.]